MSEKSNRFSESKDLFTTLSGLPVKRLYTKQDVEGIDDETDIGLPGRYPFVRGIHPTMYRSRVWTMRQLSGFGVPEETRERIRFLTDQGQTAPSLIFDAPTRWGYDSDHPMAKGAVGRVGAPLDTLQDLEEMLKGTPLTDIHFTESTIAVIVLAMLAALAEKQGVPISTLKGTVQNDILKEYSGPSMYIFPPDHSMRIVTDIIRFCCEEMPLFNPISISCTTLREAGASAVQELGFWAAHSIAYIQACVDEGLKVDAFAPKLTSFFGCHHDFFEEIAKFRAARKLWAAILKKRFGGNDPKSLSLKFHVQTSGSALTGRQPLNNITRGALAVLAGVLGGAQSIALSCYDEGLGLPSEQSVMTALRTQQIIAEESNVINTVDPLGGSYFMENLTCRMEQEAMKYVDIIDDMGGAINAVQNGFIQKEINRRLYADQEAINKGDRIIVGSNKYKIEEKSRVDIFEVSSDVEKNQIEKLNQIRGQRNNKDVEKTLSDLKTAAQGRDSLIFPIIKAVKAYASVGEICRVLKDVFGVYQAPRIL